MSIASSSPKHSAMRLRMRRPIRLTRRSVIVSTLLVTLCLWYLMSIGDHTEESTGSDASHRPRNFFSFGRGMDGHAGHAAHREAVVRAPSRVDDAGAEQVVMDTPPVDSRDAEIMSEGMVYGGDGLVTGWERVHGAYIRAGKADSEPHPIVELMDRGARRWQSLLRRQSKTLEQAVKEYRRRYNRAPPKGFDKWFQFAKDNGVKIIDEYDQIDRDIRVWLGMSPESFNKRFSKYETLQHSYVITLSPNGESTITGDQAEATRPKQQFAQLLPLAEYLDKDVKMIVSNHDMGNSIIADELRKALLDASATGTYVSEEDMARLEDGKDFGIGMLSACAPTSRARLQHEEDGDEATSAVSHHDQDPTSFMFDPRAQMSYCKTPELMKLHGAYTWPQRRFSGMRPVFQLSKLAQNHEFLLTPLEAYKNATSKEGMEATSEWKNKTVDKLFWRGSSTGDHYTQPRERGRPGYDWRQSHRPRFHFFANRLEGQANVWVKRATGWAHELFYRDELNERYMDVGFIGVPHQCDKEDGTCEQMAAEITPKDRVTPKDAQAYKYVFDIDGNGWSSRCHRLLASGSVVLKNTVYPEWVSDWLTPWVHYVPIKHDFSDIYDVMSFFTGAPDKGVETGHDELARTIADAARQFTLDHWRWEDMQAYMLRLMMEYARLSEEDREAWVYDA